MQGNVFAVKDMENRPLGTAVLHDGDNIIVAARKILREKPGMTDFHGPLAYRARAA